MMIPTAPRSKVRCRQMGEADIDAVADLLARGFAERTRQYWTVGLRCQADRPVPLDCPKFGYVLESDGAVVGAVLLLCTSVETCGQASTRCNLSSWYVEPGFRSHASLLISFALKHKHVTYVNISPARHTWPVVEAQGFTRYCSGQLFALPGLNRAPPTVTVKEVIAGAPPDERLSIWERDLLEAHAGYGCLNVVCVAPDGPHPLILLPFRIRRGWISMPCMQLIYCRDVTDFVRFAGPLGRFLLRRRILWVMFDSNGPVDGLVGIYRKARGRKYFKGPNQPRLGDLAYTELVLFGP